MGRRAGEVGGDGIQALGFAQKHTFVATGGLCSLLVRVAQHSFGGSLQICDELLRAHCGRASPIAAAVRLAQGHTVFLCADMYTCIHVILSIGSLCNLQLPNKVLNVTDVSELRALTYHVHGK